MLRQRSGEHIESRFLRIFGVGESKTEMLLLDLFHSDDPTLALYCGAGEVTARISARVPLGEDASAHIAPMEAENTPPAGKRRLPPPTAPARRSVWPLWC